MAGSLRLEQLRLNGFRNLESLELLPVPGFNVLMGGNGAGKTSVVEALHLLAHGRSFRSGSVDSLIQHGSDSLSVHARLLRSGSESLALGMARDGGGWQLRRDTRTVASLVEFVGTAAVVSIEPGSHELIVGAAEQRRRYLDWLLFHVEPGFLLVWRRYMRALRQRNAALRSRSLDYRIWDPELVESGEAIHSYRNAAIVRLDAALATVLPELAPELGDGRLRYRSGWAAGEALAVALANGRESDQSRGFTQRGPHRADWRVVLDGEGEQQDLSRGQSKSLAAACLLAQAQCLQAILGYWPILIFDDLAAELDRSRQYRLLDWLSQRSLQVFVTGTEFDEAWRTRLTDNNALFHVEQGRVQRLL